MALRDILIYLDSTPSCMSRLDLAINLAREHGAHLKGLFVLSHPFYAPRHDSIVAADAEKCQRIFAAKSADAAISSEWLCVDWSVVGVSVTEILTRYAYYADLVIIGQPDDAASGNAIPADIPERLGLGAGRPILLIPYAGNLSCTGKRIMIAWKAARATVRALHDAMPFMEKSQIVSIVSVGNSAKPDDEAELTSQMIIDHLAHHQIQAIHEHIQSTPGFPVADLLLNHACEQNMDLLVMGAFGQNRRGISMLGPVAGYLLKHMTLPVLISH
jgi:nucleotide-binding universal stress UspA family protein